MKEILLATISVMMCKYYKYTVQLKDNLILMGSQHMCPLEVTHV